MDNIPAILVTLGVLLLLGMAADILGRRTPLPRVTLLLIFGFLIGPSALHLLPDHSQKGFPIVANIALVMVGFLLGEKMTLSALREHGRLVLWISFAEVVATAGLMLAGLLLLGIRLEIALLLAGISTATDPVATSDVAQEVKSDGLFTRTLLGIVAVDDAWGLIVFSLMLTAAGAFSGDLNSMAPLLTGAWELGGALLVGIGLGIPMAYLTGRIRPGEPTLVEALGIVFLCGGVAMWLDVSFLLASMILGVVVANLARHHKRPFHAIRDIEWPFMILFFVLAGASLNIESVSEIGLIGSAYLVLRIIGRLLGGWIGGVISHADSSLRRWMGMALMPQAGVALGMTLVAAQHFPALADTILTVVIASTVLFEVVGPLLTRIALVQTGEAQAG